MIMLPEFLIVTGYYSAGNCVAHFTLYTKEEPDTPYFDEDLNFVNLKELSSIERED